MKNLLTILILLWGLHAFSQSGEFCQYSFPDTTDGCNYNFWIIDTVNNPNCIWQYGTSNKPYFNNQGKTLATDTLNPYPTNNYSSISLIITTAGLTDGIIDKISISLQYNIDTDTLKDGGYIEYSADNGNTWTNLCENTGNPNVSTLFNNQMGLSGNYSSGNFENTFDVLTITDTVLLRIVFVSDSISTNKSGWQIGIILFMWAKTVGNEINYTDEQFFPTVLNTGQEYTFPFKIINDFSIYDLTGRKINCVNIINENTFMIDGNITEGIYIIDFKNQSLIKNRKVLILNN